MEYYLLYVALIKGVLLVPCEEIEQILNTNPDVF